MRSCAPSPTNSRAAWTIATALLCALTGCAAAPVIAKTPGFAPSKDFTVAAEGLCPKLAAQDFGGRRLIVFGDTGYDLRAWMPGEVLNAAQSFVEVRPDGAFRDEGLFAGLPLDGRGYVPGDLQVGASADGALWLSRTATQYASSGALFERVSLGYVPSERGWIEDTGGGGGLWPSGAAGLPELARATMCGDPSLDFVPLATTGTAQGGVMIAGRCSPKGPTNLPHPKVLVAHGTAGASSWSVRPVAGVEHLDGIVNVGLAARSDEDAALVVYEPFKPTRERRPFAARWDGSAWTEMPMAIDEGLMSVAMGSDGALWFAAGRGVFKRDPSGAVTKVPLPAPRFVRGAPDDIHVHTVRAFGSEMWIEASYRAQVDAKKPPVWGSALFANVELPRPLYCDAALDAAEAMFEVKR